MQRRCESNISYLRCFFARHVGDDCMHVSIVYMCVAVLLSMCNGAVGCVLRCRWVCTTVPLGVYYGAVGCALWCCLLSQAMCYGDDEKFLLLGQRLYIVSHLWLFTIKK